MFLQTFALAQTASLFRYLRANKLYRLHSSNGYVCINSVRN